jgi:glycosyltransferase involved in cell wall biosynthesis
VGRLVERKGFDTAIRALAELRDRSIPARLVLLGDGVERPALERLVTELALTDRVILPGWTDNPLPSIASADAFVLPSTAEGSPLALLEAMPLGIPIVAAQSGGATAEILTHGQTGLIVADGDATALADALHTLIRDPERAGALGAAARRASDDRSPTCVAGRYADFFAQVLGVHNST